MGSNLKHSQNSTFLATFDSHGRRHAEEFTEFNPREPTSNKVSGSELVQKIDKIKIINRFYSWYFTRCSLFLERVACRTGWRGSKTGIAVKMTTIPGFIETVKSLDMAACDSPRDVSLRLTATNITVAYITVSYLASNILKVKIEPAIINFNYNYEVFQEATEGFCAANKLGQGGFAEVYKGTLKDGKEIVVKKLFVTQSTQAMEEFLTEIKIVSGFLHRNLIRLLGCCSKGQERFLVYEFMPNRSLDQHLFGEGGIHLKWIDRFKIITGTARGLVYLHEQSHFPIVHRDIKTPNILLDENLQPKIADFGLAKFFPEDKTHLTTRVGGTM
ncbi:probable LRR receptor-like serine/threonine-protein kinase At1g56140 [Cryptomeria japonica]|uniref:probable LRR receptor-like serine/threonine-protein kinase At1g56140 n=1 Tax=Cryptomeria japonica TaxID=3369 RepID=UPI0027DAB059|nr:probable LRR receptor-like serine/threonine-protein kinase At1g56140 [Cryptomeria japonica]